MDHATDNDSHAIRKIAKGLAERLMSRVGRPRKTIDKGLQAVKRLYHHGFPSA
jgi:hypothetical protein